MLHQLFQEEQEFEEQNRAEVAVEGVDMVPVEVDGHHLGHVLVHQVRTFDALEYLYISTPPSGCAQITGEGEKLGEPTHW